MFIDIIYYTTVYMQIVLLEPYPEIVPDYLNYMIDAWHTIFLYDQPYNPTDIDAIIIRSNITVDKKLLDIYTSLHYVLRVWVGLEKIDTVLLKQKWIKLINTPGSNSHAVAELVVWGMLSLLRNTYKKRHSLGDRFDLIWNELHWKKIWLIGFGNIGRIVYNILKSFGGNIFVVYDPYLDRSTLKDMDIQFVDTKEEVFAQSDIISFHLPLTPETYHILSRSDFALLKKDVKIINTSRWGIIDEESLIDFLSNNHDAGAYLDTWDWEPENPKQWLSTLANCIITPHLWSMTQEANRAMHNFTIS